MKNSTIFNGAVLAVFASTATLSASFRDTGSNVRSAGMAGASVASGNDGRSLFLNPAGPARLERREASFVYAKAYPGVEDVNINSGNLSFVTPSRYGSFALALTTLDADGAVEERVALAGYSFGAKGRFDFGVNVKYLWHDYTAADNADDASNPVYAGGTKAGAATVDAGIKVHAGGNFIVGFSGRNLTRPDVGLILEDKVPAEFGGGLAWVKNRKLTVEAGVSYRDERASTDNRKTNGRLGVEYWLNEKKDFNFALRAGAGTNEAAVGAGFLLFPKSALSFELDYALSAQYDVLEDDLGIHKISLSFWF